MRIYFKIRLSEEGRRADVIAGGSGNPDREVEVHRDLVSFDTFRSFVANAVIDGDEAVIDMRDGLTSQSPIVTVPVEPFNWVPSISELNVVYRTAMRELAIKVAAEEIRRRELGMHSGDYDFTLAGDVLLTVPIYEKTKGRNWMAVVELNGNAGGLDRKWMGRVREGQPGYYRMIQPMVPGSVIEFGADLIGASSRRFVNRWYGYLVKRTDNMIILHKAYNAAAAFCQGIAYALTLPQPAPKVIRRRIKSVYVRPEWEL